MQRLAAIVCATLLTRVGALPSQAEMRTAFAVGNTPTCRAQTCTQARAGCYRRAGNIGINCDSEFSSCMQTGVFIGRICKLSGLTRR
jgi:hypothetical protein